MAVGLVNDVGLNHQVIVNKVRRKRGIGPDPPYPGGRQEDVLRVLPVKSRSTALIPQVHFRKLPDHQVLEPRRPAAPPNGPPTRP